MKNVDSSRVRDSLKTVIKSTKTVGTYSITISILDIRLNILFCPNTLIAHMHMPIHKGLDDESHKSKGVYGTMTVRYGIGFSVIPEVRCNQEKYHWTVRPVYSNLSISHNICNSTSPVGSLGIYDCVGDVVSDHYCRSRLLKSGKIMLKFVDVHILSTGLKRVPVCRTCPVGW